MEPSKNEMNELKEKILSRRFNRDPDKKISIGDAASELADLLDKYDWFYDVVVEGRAICVYVTHMGSHTAILPDLMYGYHVKEGFASYLTCKEKYGAKPMPLSISNDFDEY
jgi:hypothetical protein